MGTNFNLPVGVVGVNVGINLTNMNLKLTPRTALNTAYKMWLCSLAHPSYACSQSDTSDVTTSQWPNTEGIAFASSTAGCFPFECYVDVVTCF
jgi:hypothetical protein